MSTVLIPCLAAHRRPRMDPCCRCCALLCSQRLIHLGYLCVYIATGASQSLLVKKSAEENGGKQPYEPAAGTQHTASPPEASAQHRIAGRASSGTHCVLVPVCCASDLFDGVSQAHHQRMHDLHRHVRRADTEAQHMQRARWAERGEVAAGLTFSLLLPCCSSPFPPPLYMCSNRDQSAKSKLLNLLSKWETARQFAVPAALYSVFNVLMFYNLRLVSPPTYRLLINLKVLFSGLLLQGLIGTKLSKRQWAGLCILVLACGVEQMDSFDMETGMAAIISICIQAFCSSFAGVYFQLLLQFRPAAPAGTQTPAAAPGSELGLWEKNLFMYCWTIAFNIVYLAIMNPTVLADPAKAASTMDAQVIPIILMSGVGGVSTSLILRDMDVIVKEYANFAEMMVVVLGSWMLLGTQLRWTLFLAVCMVTVSLYLYNIPAEAPAPAAMPMKDLERAAEDESDEPQPLLSQNDRERASS